MQSPIRSFLHNGRTANLGWKQELSKPKDVGHGQILITVGKHVNQHQDSTWKEKVKKLSKVKKTNVERAAAIRSSKRNTQHGKAQLLAALPGARHSNVLSPIHRRLQTTHVHQEVE
jgi:hypothetical protein